MPYNPYNPYNPYQQMMQYSQPTQSTGSFVSVANEQAARNYPLAPGTSGTFINENEPYCYTKTMGLSQFDRPVFKRYRLVEETDTPQSVQNTPTASPTADSSIAIPEKVTADIASLRTLYDELKIDVEILKEDMENGKSISAKSKPATDGADV